MKIICSALSRINTKNRDGSETRFYEFIQYLYSKGIEVELISIPRQFEIYKNLKFKKKYYVFDLIKSESDHLLNVLLTYFTRIISIFFKKIDTDANIFICPSDFILDVLPAIILKLKKKNISVIVWLFLVKKGLKNDLNRITFRSFIYFLGQKFNIFLFRFFNLKIFVLNENDRKLLISKGVTNVHVVNMGFNQKKIQFNNSKKIYDAIYVGRFHLQKGFFDLIEISKKVIKFKKDFCLLVIGGGPEHLQKEFDYLIKINDLSNNIKVLGFRYGEEKNNYIKNSKFFLCTSRNESWGATVIESLSLNTPVIAYDIDVFKSIFKDNLIYVNSFDVDEFATTVKNLLLNNSNFTINKNFVDSFDYSIIFNHDLNIIKEINDVPK